MIFPIGDDNVSGGFKPLFSYSLIAANVVIFVISLTSLQYIVTEFGSIPVEITNGEDLHTLFSSMFLHGGPAHIFGNMLFLWVFGDNIEAVIGNIPFFLFYILGGLAATATHISLDPSSAIPVVGASGAISAIMGAYIVMFPKSKIKMTVLFMFSFYISAIFFLGYWIFQQFMGGFNALGGESGGVAWWAHIGGFVFGVIGGMLFKNRYPYSYGNVSNVRIS